MPQAAQHHTSAKHRRHPAGGDENLLREVRAFVASERRIRALDHKYHSVKVGAADCAAHEQALARESAIWHAQVAKTLTLPATTLLGVRAKARVLEAALVLEYPVASEREPEIELAMHLARDIQQVIR